MFDYILYRKLLIHIQNNSAQNQKPINLEGRNGTEE